MSVTPETEQTLPEQLEAALSSFSHRTALKSDSSKLSYAELAGLSARIAGALQPGSDHRIAPVALLMNHDVPLIATLVGILRGGGSYFVPNLNGAAFRLKQMLAEVRPSTIVADNDHIDLAREANAARTKLLLVDELMAGPASLAPRPVRDDTLCAVFYTSGSSRKPRPLVYTHGGTLQNALNHSRSLAITSADRLTLLSPCSAAASVSSIFGALLNGAALFPFQPAERGFSEMRDWIEAESLTIYHSVPSLFRRFAESLAPGQILNPVRIVKLGGETVFASDVDLFHTHFRSDAVLINGLGLTEANGNVSHFHVTRETSLSSGTVPVGKALPGIELELLDENGARVTADAIGEICLRGKFVAPGFWTGSEVQPQTFDKAGWFRTGDLGRRNSAGLLHHLGRKDDQLKIRGHWVSIAEIESALSEIPDIREAAVVTPDRTSNEKKIICFISWQNGAVSDRRLRTMLKRKLPSYSLPHQIVALAELPVLPNGKIDRRRLLIRAESLRSPGTGDAKRPDALRLQLVRIWEKVLGTPGIDIAQDFFSLGGDSLAAATMLAAVEKYFGVHLPLSALLESSTIDKLAALIRDGGWSEAKLRLVALRLLGTKPPLYCVPGAGSDALAFRELGQHLGDDQPVFAFQPQGLDGSAPFLRSIEDIAAAHIAALREHQPHGPYYLCGSSFGGVVAFEMARGLRQIGEEIRFLGLLDSYAGDYPKLRLNLSLAQRLKLALQGLLPVAERDKITLRNLRRGIADWFQRVLVNWDLRFNFRQRPIPYRRRFVYLQEVSFSARRGYRLQPCPGRIDLFRIEHQPAEELFESDPFLGWAGLADEGIEVHSLPGFHGQHLRPPNVAILAEKLSGCLERARHRPQINRSNSESCPQPMYIGGG